MSDISCSKEKNEAWTPGNLYSKYGYSLLKQRRLLSTAKMQYFERIHTGVTRPEAQSKISSILFSPGFRVRVRVRV